MDRAVLSWSGGKDAAYALYELEIASRGESPCRVEELLTTVSETTGRSSMHGVRRPLYERQAAALDLPLNLVSLPESPDNETYGEIMNEELAKYAESGIDRVVFGDLFLEDVRAYREERLQHTSVEGTWPLWGFDTEQFARAFLDAGFEAIVVAADAEHFDPADVGRRFDETFLEELPPGVDPAGEHGEFHTFVFDGPIFETPVPVVTGERVRRSVGPETTMHFCELLAAEE